MFYAQSTGTVISGRLPTTVLVYYCTSLSVSHTQCRSENMSSLVCNVEECSVHVCVCAFPVFITIYIYRAHCLALVGCSVFGESVSE